MNKRNNANSQQNLAISWQEQIQKIELFKYYTEKDKKNILTKFSSLGQEPTFKVMTLHQHLIRNLLTYHVSPPDVCIFF